MKKILFTTAVVVLFSACQSNKSSEKADAVATIRTVMVKEVLQTNQYTYLLVKEGDSEPWLALPKMQAVVGEIYYFKGGLKMSDFESKELNRTFTEILFLDNLSASPTIVEKNSTLAPSVVSSNTMAANFENNENLDQAFDHTVIAEEVLQTSQYTYIRAKEGSRELWLATKKMAAAVGEIYYFSGGLPMTDFESKALKRTFKAILFLDNIATSPSPTEKNNSSVSQNHPNTSTGSAIPLEKIEIKFKNAKEDVSIATLFENKKSYSNKIINIRGQVTKFSPGIMEKNWLHIQDGTDFSGKFDLTVTTDQEVMVGDNITVKGVITLDKDFGYGYFYDVIMEDAKLVK